MVLSGPRRQGQEAEVEEIMTDIESLVYPKPQKEAFVKVLVFGVAVEILTTLCLWCDCI